MTLDQASMFATNWPWLLALCLALVAWRGEWQRMRAVARWFRRGALDRIGWRPVRRFGVQTVGIVALVLLAMTISRWQTAPTGTLWLLIDHSRSLAAADAAGRTRWQQFQPGLRAYATTTSRPVALIVFQRGATLLVPPTGDHAAMAQTIAAISPLIDRAGSDPQAALAMYARLRQETDSALVISDGEWDPPVTPLAVPPGVFGWGLGVVSEVPPAAGDTQRFVSRPDPAAMATLCDGHRVWGTDVTPAALGDVQRQPAETSRLWLQASVLLLLLEVVLVFRSRYRLHWERLPYRWVQRWAIWRLRHAAVLVLVVGLSGAAPDAPWPWHQRRTPARDAYDAGCAAAASGDTAAAIAAWQRAVQRDPSWQPAWYNLGTTLAGLPDRSREALKALEHASRLDPTDTWTRDNLAALRQGDQAGMTVAASPSIAPMVIPSGFTGSDLAAAVGPVASARPEEASPGPLPDLGKLGYPSALPSVSGAEINRMLDLAEHVSPADLAKLTRNAGRMPENVNLPTLTTEQLARIAALATRLPVDPGPAMDRREPTSWLQAPAPSPGPHTLTY